VQNYHYIILHGKFLLDIGRLITKPGQKKNLFLVRPHLIYITHIQIKLYFPPKLLQISSRIAPGLLRVFSGNAPGMLRVSSGNASAFLQQYSWTLPVLL